MIINFITKGRLGNAIFRYMASTIMCLYYNGSYAVNILQTTNCSDELFINIIKNIINKRNKILISNGINMDSFYQHDLIYRIHKQDIINFINNHPDHFVLTDGINAGDRRCEKFYMKDIINTPESFNKKYKNVLHIRLEDFVTHNLYLDVKRIIDLLNKDIIAHSLCIVCKKPETNFEKNYILNIEEFLKEKNINIIVESNDVLTDYYIMKEAEILICSKSTLSWCAAFFSDKIQKCYLPDYIETVNSTCKYPIDNTELY
jgi:hypothetical protein